MRFQTLIRFLAALIVLTIVAVTLFVMAQFFGIIDSNAPSEILGSDKINRLISKKDEDSDLVSIDEVRRKLRSRNQPRIVLGNPAFEKARRMLARGEFEDARSGLEDIVTKYPGTPAEREAYRVLGEIRLDEVMEHRPEDGKYVYKVKSGDSFLQIVSRHKTNLDMLKYMNNLTRIDRLRPNDELLIMPLNFSLRIVPRLNQLFLIDSSGEVIKYYEPVVDMAVSKNVGKSKRIKAIIENIRGYSEGKRVNVTHDNYRGAAKRIRITNPLINIVGEDTQVDDNFRGIVLSRPDIEELALLLRSSNTVEIRY